MYLAVSFKINLAMERPRPAIWSAILNFSGQHKARLWPDLGSHCLSGWDSIFVILLGPARRIFFTDFLGRLCPAVAGRVVQSNEEKICR